MRHFELSKKTKHQKVKRSLIKIEPKIIVQGSSSRGLKQLKTKLFKSTKKSRRWQNFRRS
jgi:hypothetical protein